MELCLTGHYLGQESLACVCVTSFLSVYAIIRAFQHNARYHIAASYRQASCFLSEDARAASLWQDMGAGNAEEFIKQPDQGTLDLQVGGVDHLVSCYEDASCAIQAVLLLTHFRST